MTFMGSFEQRIITCTVWPRALCLATDCEAVEASGVSMTRSRGLSFVLIVPSFLAVRPAHLERSDESAAGRSRAIR